MIPSFHIVSGPGSKYRFQLDARRAPLQSPRSPRRFVSYFRKETLLDQLHSLFSNLQDHDFKIVAVEPHEKDGGAFIRFSYDATAVNAEQDIVRSLRDLAEQHGGVPSWYGVSRGDIWPVKGTPWREVRLIPIPSDICPHSVLVTFRI